MHLRRLPIAAAALGLAAAALTACAPAEEEESTTGQTASKEECAVDDLALKKDGVLTIGTDKPAYEPWFVDNDPTNGEGYESAVAYAIAREMGFTDDQVEWTVVPFNNSYKPGPKDFDFDINQVSITPAREKVVDFSEGYYQAAQAIVALKDNPAADVTSVDELAGFKIAAQTGTTSLEAVRNEIQPDEDPLVFQNTSSAAQALLNGQADAIVADLPTAFYISAVQVSGSTLVGQFQYDAGQPEEFGLLFEQGSELLPCVNRAIAALEEDGTLADLENQWLSDVVSVPELQ